MGKGKGVRFGFTSKYVLLALAFLVAIAIDVAWTIHSQEAQMEAELREKGQVLSQQMASVWEFMTSNQERFEVADYSVTGSYQGLHCAVAGRTISKLFNLESDYVTRYVNFNPRNVEDTPDRFESAALEVFYANDAASEYYGIVDYEGQESFRYLVPMKVREACLKCHGMPVGELDLTGNPKEGWVEGQVGGAISIVIPTNLYQEVLRQNVLQSILFSGVMLVVLAVIVVSVAKLLSKANMVLENQKAQLEQINDRLVEESQYKTDFLSMVSHELRTPLTSIVAFSEMLGNDNLSPGKEEAIRQGIDANSRALLLKVNNLLEASRYNAGRLKLERDAVDIYELAGIVDLVIPPLAQQNEIQFAIEVGKNIPIVEGDFDKLLLILENLCSNAVKFTPRGGSVVLRISYDAESDEVRMQVIDTGIGIPAGDLERVFLPFESSSSAMKGKYPGTGLGLPMARTCAEMHGGRIIAESETGKGSSFTVIIPVRSEEGKEVDG